MAIQGGAFTDDVNTNQAALNAASGDNPTITIPSTVETTMGGTTSSPPVVLGPQTTSGSPVVATVTQVSSAPAPPGKNLIPGVAVALVILTVVLNAVLAILSKISIPQASAISSGAVTALGIVKYLETIYPTTP